MRLNKVDRVEKFTMTLLIESLLMKKSFRNVFYLRCGLLSFPLSWILKPVPNVELSKHILGGVVLNHGFSVVMNPRVKIGRNCTIHQNVTIGDVNGGVPILGDNVSIGAGAIIIGKIRVGNNVKIGAGAIVVNDVPDGVTVVGEKAKILNKATSS